MGFVDDYQRDVWDQRKLLPQYPPSGKVTVGDVLEKRDGVWKVRSNLTETGFEPKVVTSKSADISLQSKGTVSVSASAKADSPAGVFTQVLGEAGAEVNLSFTRDFGYAMALSGVREAQLQNIDALIEHIQRTQRWHWDFSFLVVTETYTARSSTILTTSTRGATATLKAKADVKPGGVKVAAASVGYELTSSSQLEDKWVSVSDMTPLYGVRKMKITEIILGGTHASPRQGVDGAGELADDIPLSIPERTVLSAGFEDFDPENDL